jgi:putative MATE family efflux protein
MLSMLAQALYNIVDTIFVSRVGEEAVAAVTLAFPLQNLMVAVCVGLGVGVNSFLSRSLGEHNTKNVNSAAMHGILLSWCFSAVFCAVGLLGARAFMETQTDNPAILNDGTTYIMIVCGIPFGVFNQFMMERLLQATGKTIYSMFTQILGALVNTTFDYLLIFGIGFFPKLGVAGAAIATVMGQAASALLGIYFNLSKNKEIHFSFKGFRLNPKILRSIFSVGLPSMALSSLGSVMSYGMNLILVRFSHTAVAFFGVYFKLQSFVFMPVFGLNNGMVPITAYNFGAGRRKRVDKTIKLALAGALVLQLLGVTLFELFPAEILRLFNASEELLGIGITGMRIIALHLPLAAFTVIFMSSMQAFGVGLPPLLISFARQIVVLLPVAYLLSLTGKPDDVWWSYPIAEGTATILAACFFARSYKRLVRPMNA